MKPGQTFDLGDRKIQSIEQDGSQVWDRLGQNISGDEEAPAERQPVGAQGPKPQAAAPPPLAREAASQPAPTSAQPAAGQSSLSPPGPAKPEIANPEAAKPQRAAEGNPQASSKPKGSASQAALQKAAERAHQQHSYRWLAVLAATLAALLALLLVADTVSGVLWLFSLSSALGLLGSLLLATLLTSLVILIGREWRALARMSRQRHLRQLTEAALSEPGAPGADQAMAAVEAAYARQDNTAWMLAQFRELAPREGYSAVDRLEVFEREVLRKLDSQAVDIIEENARNTAVITTISPFALFDALFTLWRNLRMIRQVATVYGVAPGFWGSMRLLRQVFANVLLTGGLEAADGALNQLLGGSLTAKLSTKLSEGLVNGMLSARLGLAAMDQCRPLPFKHNRRPRLSDIGARLVGSVRKSIMKGSGRD